MGRENAVTVMAPWMVFRWASNMSRALLLPWPRAARLPSELWIWRWILNWSNLHTQTKRGKGVDIVPLNADTDVTLPHGISTSTCMDAHYTLCALLSRSRARDYASYNHVCVCVRADRCRGAHLTVMLAPCPTCLDTSPTRWQAG